MENPRVGQVVSTVEKIITANDEVIPANTWGDITHVNETMNMAAVKFRNHRNMIWCFCSNLTLRNDLDEAQMIREYAEQGGFEPDDNVTYMTELNQTENPPHRELVDHPAHYQGENGIECIDAIEAMLGREGFIAWLRGTIFKHDWRLGKKDEAHIDLGKSDWYRARLREVLLEE